MKKKGFVIAMATSLILGTAQPAQALSSMTPYPQPAPTDTMYNGAMLELKRSGDVDGWLTRELTTMKTEYNINTVNIYGLESFDRSGNANKEALFRELKRLDMQVVVRIESYSQEFAFRESDLPYILNLYQNLLDFVCAPEHREQVAYFSLNMPVDDGRVQDKIGGVNSELSKQRQVSYAQAFVRQMREETARRGFNDAKMFLSIFYGWDNSYQIPSYASAGADGYFMNNYSYPKNNHYVPDENASDSDLINRPRLSISVSKYRSQYPGKPLVVEFGFHTIEYNHGVRPNQTAGLVKNRAAKERAVRATIEYYKTIPEFRGALYFGYNLYKEEGNPPAVMDWTLVYPEETPSSSATTTTSTTKTEMTTQNAVPGTSATPDVTNVPENTTVSETFTSGTESITGATVPADTEKKEGMSLAMKIWLGILGVATAALSALLAVWWWMNRRKQAE